MSQTSDRERADLDAIAWDVREELAARAHHIGQAISLDPAFDCSDTQKALARALVRNAVITSASKHGFGCGPTPGGGLELGSALRRYRVRRGKRNLAGKIVIESNGESSFADDSEDALLQVEPWVFSWIPAPDNTIAEMVIARIWGQTDGKPGHLILGPDHPVGLARTTSAGFTPKNEDEDLDHFLEDDEDDLGDAGESGA